MRITPDFNSTAKLAKKVDKNAIATALAHGMQEVVETPDGLMTVAEAIAKRLLSTAIFAENNKDSTSAAKVVLEYTAGKPAVQNQDKKTEIPAMVISVNDNVMDKLQTNASGPSYEPDFLLDDLDEIPDVEVEIFDEENENG